MDDGYIISIILYIYFTLEYCRLFLPHSLMSDGLIIIISTVMTAIITIIIILVWMVAGGHGNEEQQKLLSYYCCCCWRGFPAFPVVLEPTTLERRHHGLG